MNGIAIALLLPFLGTTLGAACVFLMRSAMPGSLKKILVGFAVWFLLMMALDVLLG